MGTDTSFGTQVSVTDFILHSLGHLNELLDQRNQGRRCVFLTEMADIFQLNNRSCRIKYFEICDCSLWGYGLVAHAFSQHSRLLASCVDSIHALFYVIQYPLLGYIKRKLYCAFALGFVLKRRRVCPDPGLINNA